MRRGSPSWPWRGLSATFPPVRGKALAASCELGASSQERPIAKAADQEKLPPEPTEKTKETEACKEHKSRRDWQVWASWRRG